MGARSAPLSSISGDRPVGEPPAPHDLAIGLEVLGELPPPRSAVAEETQGEATGLLAILGDSPWLALEVWARALDRRREITLVCEDGVAPLPAGYSDHVQLARSPNPRDTGTGELGKGASLVDVRLERMQDRAGREDLWNGGAHPPPSAPNWI